MKERYPDMTGSNGCTAFLLKDTRIIQARTTAYSDILVTDSRGGYLAAVGVISDPNGFAPICYVN